MKHFYTILFCILTFGIVSGQEPPNVDGDLTYVKLLMYSATDSYSTDVYFNDNATLGFDFGFDAEFFETPPAFSIYTRLVQDDMGAPFTIQAVDTESLGNVTITVGANAPQGQQITFTLSEVSLPPTTEVYLDDSLENTSTLLTGSDYTITPSSDLQGTSRFSLRFFDATLSTVETNIENNVTISALNDSKEIRVKGQLQENSVLRLYDIQGKQILSVQLEATHLENHIDISSLNTGVYVAQLQSGALQKSQKLIVK